MGNTIKNYQKKKRKERKEANKKIQKIVHNKIMDSLPYNLKELKEKENEIYNNYISNE